MGLYTALNVRFTHKYYTSRKIHGISVEIVELNLHSCVLSKSEKIASSYICKQLHCFIGGRGCPALLQIISCQSCNA